MASKFCESCGAAIEEGAKFCPNCGKTAESAPPPASAPTPPPASAPTPPPQQNTAQSTAYTPPAQAPQQNLYQQPVDNAPLSVGQYFVMMLLLAIPIANIIMPFVWAFGSGQNVNKRNYGRAILIWALIGIGLFVIGMITIIPAIIGALSNPDIWNYYEY